MNLYRINIFISIAKHLNFTRAAEDFNTSQPTISRQLSLLEEEWGFPLFIRLPHLVRLTPEGAVMLRVCKDIVNKLESGLEEVRELQQGKTGRLNIGCLEAMDITLFVEPTASYFSRRYPDVDISLERRSFAELRNKLHSGELDIIFTLDFEINAMENVVYNIYYPVQALFLMSSNHPLAGKKDLKPADLADQTLVLPEEPDSPGREEEIKGLCRKNGFEFKNIIYVKNQASVMLYARSGKGVAIADTSVENVFDKNLYSFLPLSHETAPLSVVYAWEKNNLNPAVALFGNTLMERGPVDIYNS